MSIGFGALLVDDTRLGYAGSKTSPGHGSMFPHAKMRTPQ